MDRLPYSKVFCLKITQTGGAAKFFCCPLKVHDCHDEVKRLGDLPVTEEEEVKL